VAKQTDETRAAASETDSPFASVEEAIEDIRRGRMVVVCDDENRENEGDLTMAAQFATPEAINFMAKNGRGLICLALTDERCQELGLNLMAAKNEAPFETAFTVSVEAREGVTTGISAADRARTIQVAIDPHSQPQDLVQPGHVFPLKAKDGGVLERTGQTEAAVDLARLAGLIPAGVIPDRLPPAHREADRANRLDQAADRLRRVHGRRLPLADRRQAPRRDGQGRRGRGR
jgi:3,4-dihydroxy 2-butanone 4-phosphate synthase / GTP cyclohydrolase II